MRSLTFRIAGAYLGTTSDIRAAASVASRTISTSTLPASETASAASARMIMTASTSMSAARSAYGSACVVSTRRSHLYASWAVSLSDLVVPSSVCRLAVRVRGAKLMSWMS